MKERQLVVVVVGSLFALSRCSTVAGHVESGLSFGSRLWSIKKKKCWTRDSHEHQHPPTTSTMAAIGSLVFCESCGNLLDSANGDDSVVLTCDVCGAKCKGMLKNLLHSLFIYTRAWRVWKNMAWGLITTCLF